MAGLCVYFGLETGFSLGGAGEAAAFLLQSQR
jgi:hypothetical protein